jgi:hypothetical protein
MDGAACLLGKEARKLQTPLHLNIYALRPKKDDQSADR